MRRLIILLAVLCASITLQGQPTAIVDTLYNADGVTLYNGLITITWAVPFVGGDGHQVPVGAPKRVAVTNGVLSTTLEANDTATPAGTSYQVSYTPIASVGNFQTWVVNYTGGTRNLSAIQSSSTPPLTPTVTLSQITQSGASVNDVPHWNGTAWVAGAPPAATSYWTQNGTDLYYVAGKVGAGTNAPGYSLDVSGGAGNTFRCYDRTASTGITSCIIRAGIAQSTTHLAEWQNNAGTALGWIESGGIIDAPQLNVQQTAGNFLNLAFVHGALVRFNEVVANDASYWALSRYDDSGNFVDNPIQVTRSTGALTFSGLHSVSGTRFLCVSTTGLVTASATACSGT